MSSNISKTELKKLNILTLPQVTDYSNIYL